MSISIYVKEKIKAQEIIGHQGDNDGLKEDDIIVQHLKLN